MTRVAGWETSVRFDAVLIAVGMVLFVTLKLAELWLGHKARERAPKAPLPCSKEVPRHLQEVGRSLERVGVALDRLDERMSSQHDSLQAAAQLRHDSSQGILSRIQRDVSEH